MKSFKEFQNESYSRLDEGWGIVKTAGNLLIPYLAWLWVAFTLNAYVVVMN